jgi:hypothetical protein
MHLPGWHDRYARYGLIVVGVHAPEFDFARQLENVQRAVTEEGFLHRQLRVEG